MTKREKMIALLRSLDDKELEELEELIEYAAWIPELVGPSQPPNQVVDRGAFQKLFTPGLRKAFEDTYRCRK